MLKFITTLLSTTVVLLAVLASMVYAEEQYTERSLTTAEIQSILDLYQVDYAIQSEPANSVSITRAELLSLIERDQIPLRLQPTTNRFPLEAQIMVRSGWQRHSCRPNGTYPHVELGGQTDSRVIEGQLYFFDHRREYANTRNITPRTYIITEGPDGQLSRLAGWHTGNRAYARYTVSVAYDVQNCIGTFCWYIDYDVEDSCAFRSN